MSILVKANHSTAMTLSAFRTIRLILELYIVGSDISISETFTNLRRLERSNLQY